MSSLTKEEMQEKLDTYRANREPGADNPIIGIGLMVVLFLGVAAAIFLSSWLVLFVATPIAWLFSYPVLFRIAMGKFPDTPGPPDIKTVLVNGHMDRQKASIWIRPSGIEVKSPNQTVKIPFEQITRCLWEDKTVDDHFMAGFSIDYHDETGPARLIFFEDGWFPVSHVKSHTKKIKDAHSAYFGANTLMKIGIVEMKEGI
jgi:hypothetical protein